MKIGDRSPVGPSKHMRLTDGRALYSKHNTPVSPPSLPGRYAREEGGPHSSSICVSAQRTMAITIG